MKNILLFSAGATLLPALLIGLFIFPKIVLPLLALFATCLACTSLGLLFVNAWGD